MGTAPNLIIIKFIVSYDWNDESTFKLRSIMITWAATIWRSTHMYQFRNMLETMKLIQVHRHATWFAEGWSKNHMEHDLLDKTHMTTRESKRCRAQNWAVIFGTPSPESSGNEVFLAVLVDGCSFSARGGRQKVPDHGTDSGWVRRKLFRALKAVWNFVVVKWTWNTSRTRRWSIIPITRSLFKIQFTTYF